MAKRIHEGGMFHTMEAFRKFLTAGNAVFTMVSNRTGERFTYRVRRPKGEKKPLFVQLLNGPDNTNSYAYFGLMFGENEKALASYRYGAAKAKVPQTAPSVRGFEWLIRNIQNDATLDQVQLWHQGRCGKCRKALTVPESIQSGLGPVCARGGRD